MDVPAGACLLVVGPSGSGKSTLGLAIAGLIPRDIPAEVRGEITVAGVDPRTTSPAEMAAQVGIVFQDPGSQLVMDRVEDDVAFGLENRAWPPAKIGERVTEVIADVGLTGLERRRSNRLSGGQQQRLALAGALAPRPAVLVLDEPTANLDPDAAKAFFARLRRLRAMRSTTIVLVEHRVEAAWQLADCVLALDAAGNAIDVGLPEEVLVRSAIAMDAAGIWLPISYPEKPSGGLRPRTGIAPPVVVTAIDVGFEYERGASVLDGVGASLAAGERVALVGPNGSGKSTLGRLLVGLLRPTTGRVRLFDADPAAMAAPALARRAGYVFQDPEAGFLTETVNDEVRLGLPEAVRDDVPALMERLRLPLDEFGDRSPFRLSGGEARRLSLACTLVRHPALLVLDEPTFGQDRLGYEGLLEILRERLDAGVCLVAATHDRRLVADVASRIIELADGRIARDRRVEAPRPAR